MCRNIVQSQRILTDNLVSPSYYNFFCKVIPYITYSTKYANSA